VEHLIMGMFVSSAFFELSERLATLPPLNSTDEIRAAVVIVTTYHSLVSRSASICTINNLVPKLWQGSLLYALSLLGTSIFVSLFLLGLV
jgi:hypothetical protein